MFKLGDQIIDRIQFAYLETLSGDPMFVLTQLSTASVAVSADSTDITDKDGSVIYTKYTGKKAEFTSTNALLNLNVVGAASGVDPKIASSSDKITMPKMVIVKPGATVDVTGYVAGTVKVVGLDKKNSMVAEYSLSESTADETKFAIAGNDLTLPTDADAVQFVVKYDREVSAGNKITIDSTHFPKTCHMILKALAVDPCETDTLKAIYIDMPQFQPNADFTLPVGGDSKEIDFNGNARVGYCDPDKELFSVYSADADVEE